MESSMPVIQRDSPEVVDRYRICQQQCGSSVEQFLVSRQQVCDHLRENGDARRPNRITTLDRKECRWIKHGAVL
jgi:hypothetical protein